MTLYINGHAFLYEMENLVRMFFPNTSLTVRKNEFPQGEDYILTKIRQKESGWETVVKIHSGGREQQSTGPLPGKEPGKDWELLLATRLYDLLSAFCGRELPWGILTGIRPVKLVHAARREGLSDAEIRRRFLSEYRMSEAKTDLAFSIADIQRPLIARSGVKSFSLYVSIPFCPTRCSYCSFVSHSIEKTRKLVGPYVKLLCEEIRLTGELAQKAGLKLESVYFGGGTPTSLSAGELRVLLQTVRHSFDVRPDMEFTVEAGRPDTVTLEKLETLKAEGVNRISINPQTLNPKALLAIGRRHTVEQFYESFDLARSVGFSCINTDLIAGLPGDTPETFSDTLRNIMRLSPENVTVHTLSVKRSSSMTGDDAMRSEPYAQAMLNSAYQVTGQQGYLPYYLYRQKNTLHNLENTGFCKKGFESAYNVYIMDETHTILAAGAGGVTKIKNHATDALHRVFNYKYPYEYIDRFETVLERKRAIWQEG